MSVQLLKQILKTKITLNLIVVNIIMDLTVGMIECSLPDTQNVRIIQASLMFKEATLRLNGDNTAAINRYSSICGESILLWIILNTSNRVFKQLNDPNSDRQIMMTLRQAATSRRCSGCQSHQTCDNCTLPAVCCTPLLKRKTTEQFPFSEKRRWLFNIKSTILYHVYLSSILSIVDKRGNHKRKRETIKMTRCTTR